MLNSVQMIPMVALKNVQTLNKVSLVDVTMAMCIKR